jgi:plasmid stability protein
MAQLTIRLTDELASEVKTHAAGTGRSLNNWVVALLRAAVDPELADSESERLRARLERAGLLAPVQASGRTAPDAKRVHRARRAAGRGTPLAKLVVENRR